MFRSSKEQKKRTFHALVCIVILTISYSFVVNTLFQLKFYKDNTSLRDTIADIMIVP